MSSDRFELDEEDRAEIEDELEIATDPFDVLEDDREIRTDGGNASSDTDRFDSSSIQKVGIQRIPTTVDGGSVGGECVPERLPLTFGTGFYSGTESHKTAEIQHLLPLLLTTSGRSVKPATEHERGDR